MERKITKGNDQALFSMIEFLRVAMSIDAFDHRQRLKTIHITNEGAGYATDGRRLHCAGGFPPSMCGQWQVKRRGATWIALETPHEPVDFPVDTCVELFGAEMSTYLDAKAHHAEKFLFDAIRALPDSALFNPSFLLEALAGMEGAPDKEYDTTFEADRRCDKFRLTCSDLDFSAIFMGMHA